MFLWAKNLGISRSSDAWNSDRATPMMAFSTDSSRAKMSGMPIRYLTQPALPKMWSAKLVYRVNGSEVLSDAPSTATNTMAVAA